MSFLAIQPNGLLCRISSISDGPTHWNMTQSDFILMNQLNAAQEAEIRAHRSIKRAQDWDYVLECWENLEDENLKNEWEEFLKEASVKPSQPFDNGLITIGQRIENLRNELGISKIELARRSGLSAPTMSTWTLGDREPSFKAMRVLAECFGLTLSQLLEGVE